MQIDIQARGFKLTEGLRAQAERRVRFALGSTSGRVRNVVMRLADENIWGTNDGVITSVFIDASKPYLPADTRYVALQGANHTQFGWYGTSATDYGFMQPKDNPAAITGQQQNDLIVQYTLSLLNSLTTTHVPAALETITADDGSTWERVNAPGIGSNDNKCVVALSGYNGRLYAATRNDVSSFELWRTNGTGWEKLNVPGLTDQNNFYGYILPFDYVDPNTDRKKFNLMQNIWGDMIVYNGYLYLAIETGYQGNILYGSVGCQILAFQRSRGVGTRCVRRKCLNQAARHQHRHDLPAPRYIQPFFFEYSFSVSVTRDCSPRSCFSLRFSSSSSLIRRTWDAYIPPYIRFHR